MLKRLLELLADTLAYGASGFLAQIVGFLLLPLYTRQLTPADYGILAMLAILPTVFQVLASSGTKSAVFKFFYAEPDLKQRPVIVTTAAASVSCSTLIVLSISSIFAGQIGHLLLGAANDIWLVQIALMSAAVSIINEVPIIALRTVRRAKTVGILNLVFLLISISLNVIAVLVLKWGVRGLVLASLVGNCLQCVMSFAITQSLFGRKVDFAMWRRMAGYALPFFPHRLQAVGLGFVAEYSIRNYLGLAEAGLYSIALKFAMPLAFISGALQQAWVPYKFKVHAEEKDSAAFFRSFFSYFMFLFLYLWVGISAWGPEAVRLLTQPEFHQATYFVWAAALVVLARSIPPVLSVGIELNDSPKHVPIASFCALIVLIVGSVLLVPSMGVIGAAFASSLSWITLAVAYWYLGQQQLRITYDWRSFALLLIIATFMVTLTYSAQSWTLGPRIILGISISLAFPVIGLLIYWFSPYESRRVNNLCAEFRGRSNAILGILSR